MIPSCFTLSSPNGKKKLKALTLNCTSRIRQSQEPHWALKNHAKAAISKVSLAPFSSQTHSLVRDSLTDDMRTISALSHYLKVKICQGGFIWTTSLQEHTGQDNACPTGDILQSSYKSSAVFQSGYGISSSERTSRVPEATALQACNYKAANIMSSLKTSS